MTTILVIEDEPAIRENVIETLELEGFQVIGAENGRAGVSAARSYLPSLIICDIMMPELNGYGVLHELRSDNATANIPFMFLTARADRSDMRKGMELGADDYLVKPFTTAELLAAVDARIMRQATIEREFEQKLDNLRDNIILALPHELRTPLTGIIGYSEMLMMDFDTVSREQIISMVSSIHKSGMRLYRLIENYLLYAHLEIMSQDQERVIALRNSPLTRTGSTIADAASQVACEFQRGDDLSLELDDAPARIAQDSLAKVTTELVNNAFKFSLPGKPVYVQTFSAGGSFLLVVADQGRGIPSDQIKNIGAYMQFERAVYEQQGLGLGLALVKRVVEMYGGQLFVESAIGSGTTVTVALPG